MTEKTNINIRVLIMDSVLNSTIKNIENIIFHMIMLKETSIVRLVTHLFASPSTNLCIARLWYICIKGTAE